MTEDEQAPDAEVERPPGTHDQDPDWQARLLRLARADADAARVLDQDYRREEAGDTPADWPPEFRVGSITPDAVHALEEHLGLEPWRGLPARPLPSLTDGHARRLRYGTGDQVLIGVAHPACEAGDTIRVASRSRPEGWAATVTETSHGHALDIAWQDADEVVHAETIEPGGPVVQLLPDGRPTGPWRGVVVGHTQREIRVVDEFEAAAKASALMAGQVYEPVERVFRRRNGAHVRSADDTGPEIWLLGRAETVDDLDQERFTTYQSTLILMAERVADMPLGRIEKLCKARVDQLRTTGPKDSPEAHVDELETVQAVHDLAAALHGFQAVARRIALSGEAS